MSGANCPAKIYPESCVEDNMNGDCNLTLSEPRSDRADLRSADDLVSDNDSPCFPCSSIRASVNPPSDKGSSPTLLVLKFEAACCSMP